MEGYGKGANYAVGALSQTEPVGLSAKVQNFT